MQRRTFLIELAAALAAASSPRSLWAADRKRPHILLRGSWQTVNIGDIAHTPGALRLLADNIPEAEVTLWPSSIGDGVEALLLRNFPRLKIASKPADVERAFAECDFLLHGSGASFVAQKHVGEWSQKTGKPYGIYGITLGTINDQARELLTAARFVFFRDTVSLQFARDAGVKCPVMEFGPDAAFGCNLRNDEAASSFLRANDLEPGKFLCCIPRLRYTPYWIIRNREMTDEDRRKHARSEEMKEHDHVPLREAITAVVRQTRLKVLVCPEDQSQMAVGRAMIVDPLPDDVKSRVVWREKYWLTDEALSTYVQSAGLFGLEMHSPIMCIGNGVPAIVCRFQEQTTKGLMWRDIGLGNWLFDMDNVDDLARLVPTVLELAKDPDAAKAKAAQARKVVETAQRTTMAVVKKSLA